ncbi:AAA family ATPase [Mycobacterium sp. 21AC1]|uniref:BTAD domain-containing putative transcriptional regulator n=1 Tax=[Mycobacterium] appelbergii TaxID=2939269 RepID=UPI002938EB9B|nr:BTAD domain-containing putative transcriptional regulator [Mycobacterium sp. 21AC1]MDV3126618.1 AAA family ATPase [Mycobacterium sp. 21AC1]
MTVGDNSTVRISVLGPIRVWVAGDPVELGGRRQRSVLARLAIAHGQVVSVDRLIDDLWEGEPPPKALASLQAYISHLRRMLEPDRAPRTVARIIVSAAPGYCLGLPADAVDAWHFESKVAVAEDKSDPAERAQTLEEALASWSGAPYAEVVDTLWAAPEVARLTELRLATVESHAQAMSMLGRDATVVRALERHVRDHPGRESAAGLLAAALYRTGRQTAALDVLRRTREHLVDELGLEPARPLRDLERDILRQAEHLDPIPLVEKPIPQPDTGQAPARPRGRAAELAVIGQAAAAVERDGSRVLWVCGEAGVGKTTLVDVAAERLSTTGWAVASGRCPEVAGAPPGWAWTEVIREFTASSEVEPSAALGALLHDGSPTRTRGGGTFWLAHALAELLSEVATRRPLAIVLDDLHRTDGLTLELLRLAADRLTGDPVLLIGTYRPSESGPELETARAALANRAAAHLNLTGLDEAATAELAADYGLSMVAGETLRLLRERTGGNPLFVRELARLMVAEGAEAAKVGVPAGVRDVLRRRLARLPGPTASALRQAAVLGRDVDLDLLGELASGNSEELLDALEPAVLAGLLDEPSPGRARFAHALVRDTIYDDMSILRRSRLHAAALELLRRPDSVADATSLAYHAVSAATPDTAVAAAEFAITAAREADTVGAPAESARQWRAAVRMFDLAGTRSASPPQPDTGEHSVPARCGLISALARAGDVASARDELRRTLTVVAGDDALTVRVLTAWDAPLVWRLRTTDAADPHVVAPLRRVLGRDHPDSVRARLLLALFAELEGADTPAALTASSAGLDCARAIYAEDPDGSGRLLCAALNARAYAALGPDIAAERDTMAEELLAVAERCGAVDYQAVAHWLLFLSHASRSDLATALGHVDLAVARAGTGQLGYLLGVLDVFEAQLTVLAGRPDDGERRYAAAAAALSEHGAPNGALMALVGRITAALFRNDLGPLADELLVVHHTVSVSVADVVVLALLAAGRTGEAQRIWAEQAGRAPVERVYYWLAMTTLRAHAAVGIGDEAVARAAFDELRPYSGRMAGLDNGTLLAGPVDEALAAVADMSGDVEQAQRYRAEAAALRRRLAADAARLLSRTPDGRIAGGASTTA